MRPEAVDPLSYEEHRDFGTELRKTKARLLQLSSVVAGIYSPQSRAAFEFRKLIEAVDRTASEMEAQAEIDCPGRNAGELYR